MMSKMKVHCIIHGATLTAGAVGFGLAQLPCSDSVPLVSIQTGMVKLIAGVHGRNLTQAAAMALISTFAATMAGRNISQLAGGWIPLYGNALNATTAAGITEAMGWMAHGYFKSA